MQQVSWHHLHMLGRGRGPERDLGLLSCSLKENSQVKPQNVQISPKLVGEYINYHCSIPCIFVYAQNISQFKKFYIFRPVPLKAVADVSH